MKFIKNHIIKGLIILASIGILVSVGLYIHRVNSNIKALINTVQFEANHIQMIESFLSQQMPEAVKAYNEQLKADNTPAAK